MPKHGNMPQHVVNVNSYEAVGHATRRHTRIDRMVISKQKYLSLGGAEQLVIMSPEIVYSTFCTAHFLHRTTNFKPEIEQVPLLQPFASLSLSDDFLSNLLCSSVYSSNTLRLKALVDMPATSRFYIIQSNERKLWNITSTVCASAREDLGT